jgi:hypothetical protein
MSTSTAAAILLIALPLAFNVAFGVLGARFDYPDILRRSTVEVLARFREGGTGLVMVWWAFMLTAVLVVPLVVLLAGALDGADGTLLAVGVAVGVLAAAVQFIGLSRWPFLVPYLARAEVDATPARREAIDVTFQSFNRFLGVAVGEHLGYGLTGGGARLPARRSSKAALWRRGWGWSGSSSGPRWSCARSSSSAVRAIGAGGPRRSSLQSLTSRGRCGLSRPASDSSRSS